MGQLERDFFIKNVFTTVAPVVDGLTTAFSFGLCHIWRRTLLPVSGIKAGDRVLDACTGTGELAFRLARKVGPGGSVTGVDFCEEMLEEARRKTDPALGNVSFILADAKNLPFAANTFDAATVAFGMRNIPDTASALREAHRVLKPGGSFVCLELTRPLATWFVPIYKWYLFKVIPFIGGIVTKSETPYSYLPVSIETYYSPREFARVMGECGFSDIRTYSLSMGIATIYRGIKSE